MHVKIMKLQQNVITFTLEVFVGDRNPHYRICDTGAGSGEQSSVGRVSPGTEQSGVEKEGATPFQVAGRITQRRQPLHYLILCKLLRFKDWFASVIFSH